MLKLVDLKKKNSTALLILNAPPANALNIQLMEELSEMVKRVKEDQEVRSVIISSGLEKIFVAGADLKVVQKITPEDFNTYLQKVQSIFSEVERMPKPVIAAINGHAMGGGFELAMACDFRFMVKGARLGLPEVTLGLLPAGGGTQRLPRIVGKGRAIEILLTGKSYEAREAYELGIVQRIFDDRQNLMEESFNFAKDLASQATMAIAMIKECINQGLDESIEKGLKLERENIQKLLFSTEDAKEGITAFMEKRKASFKGR